MGGKNRVLKAIGDWLEARRQAQRQVRAERLATTNEQRRLLALESLPYASEAAAEAANFASTLTQSFESLLGRLKPLVENRHYRLADNIKGNKPLQIEIDRSLDSLKEVAQSSVDASKNLLELAKRTTEIPEVIEAATQAKKAADKAWQAVANAKAKFEDMLSAERELNPEDFIRSAERAVAELKEAERVVREANQKIMTDPRLLAGFTAPVLTGDDSEKKATSGEATWNTIADTTSLAVETVVMPVLDTAAPVLDAVDAVKIGALNRTGFVATGGQIKNAGEIVDKAEGDAIGKGVIKPLGVVVDKGIKPAVVGTVDNAIAPVTDSLVKIPGQVVNPIINLVNPTPGKIVIEDKPARELKFPSYSHVPDQKPSVPREGTSDEVWAAAAGKQQSVEAFTEDSSMGPASSMSIGR
ncbi:MAG: hypothetical protein K1X66_01540 [Verrucomicrobiae bacterium]|nr:hypothetical protein [Verrucomicrobiae bacterium]